MSLLKAYKLEPTELTLHETASKFTRVYQELVDERQFNAVSVAVLVNLYTDYACEYLRISALTLKQPEGSDDTMKLMNSIIAEFVHLAHLHYFDLERGYSIIDKALQNKLDNNENACSGDVLKVIEEIEASYAEQQEDETLQ